MKKINKEQIEAMIGQTVTWASGSQGATKEKTGTILAFIPKETYFDLVCYPQFFSDDFPSITQKKFDPMSSNDRFLVEVPRFHKRTGEPIGSYYYAPRASTFLKKQ